MEEISEIKKLIAQNRKDILEVKRELHKVRKSLLWSNIFSILRILLIVVPIAIGIILLLPYFDQIISEGGNILDSFRIISNIGSFNPDVLQNAPDPSQQEFNSFIQRFQEVNQ